VRLLLASASAARRRLLEAAGVPFATVDTRFDEDDAKTALRACGIGAAKVAVRLAEGKARAACNSTEALILGCDQTLELADGTRLDKPADRADLIRQLGRMSGQSHRLHAAACIVEQGEMIWRCVESVTMHVRPLGSAFLRDYVDREWEQVRWSVGGYHVEGRGAQLFERIDGSHFAVQGLPLLPLLGFLRTRGLVRE
jgi:septum formation protein